MTSEPVGGFQETLLRCLDSAAAAPAWRPREGARALRTLLLGSRHFERIPAGLALLDRFAPGVAAVVSRRVARVGPLALAASRIEVLGYGAAATAFRIETRGGPLALKVFRRSLGRPFDEQRAIAAHHARRYRTVSEWFRSVPGLITPTRHLLLPGPILGRPVAAAVQALVSGRIRCFFDDLAPEEALALLRACPPLREQFQAFADRALAIYATERRCLDLVGHENLMLVEKGGGQRLAVIDFGFFDVAALEREAPDRARALAERIGRLDALRRGLDRRA